MARYLPIAYIVFIANFPIAYIVCMARLSPIAYIVFMARLYPMHTLCLWLTFPKHTLFVWLGYLPLHNVVTISLHDIVSRT